MGALTADRDTPRKLGDELRELPVAASTKIFAGSLVMVNSSGDALAGAAAAAAGLSVGGVCQEFVDNSAGLAGDKTVKVRHGIHRFNNGDSFTKADVGKVCFLKDDNTVGAAAAARSPVGLIHEVDSAGVWVDVKPIAVPDAANADLTDSTSGTADGTVSSCATAVTGVDGTGSNAASKADVDARLVTINNNFKEVTVELNEIKATLRKQGLLAEPAS